jgi:hypothetical protein
VVILIFIFLTPKSWFDNGERPVAMAHQSAVITKVVLPPEVVANEADRLKIEQQVRNFTGRSNFKVIAVRKLVNSDGSTIGFEVDIQ